MKRKEMDMEARTQLEQLLISIGLPEDWYSTQVKTMRSMGMFVWTYPRRWMRRLERLGRKAHDYTSLYQGLEMNKDPRPDLWGRSVGKEHFNDGKDYGLTPEDQKSVVEWGGSVSRAMQYLERHSDLTTTAILIFKSMAEQAKAMDKEATRYALQWVVEKEYPNIYTAYIKRRTESLDKISKILDSVRSNIITHNRDTPLEEAVKEAATGKPSLDALQESHFQPAAKAQDDLEKEKSRLRKARRKAESLERKRNDQEMRVQALAAQLAKQTENMKNIEAAVSGARSDEKKQKQAADAQKDKADQLESEANAKVAEVSRRAKVAQKGIATAASDLTNMVEVDMPVHSATTFLIMQLFGKAGVAGFDKAAFEEALRNMRSDPKLAHALIQQTEYAQNFYKDSAEPIHIAGKSGAPAMASVIGKAVANLGVDDRKVLKEFLEADDETAAREVEAAYRLHEEVQEKGAAEQTMSAGLAESLTRPVEEEMVSVIEGGDTESVNVSSPTNLVESEGERIGELDEETTVSATAT
eukprot:GHVN01066445.1.p1 GENE.GHVN01066445.1~~GHVN01066445.1.p1  ORF type:complete len:527 (-),score=90.76 GHVN01066445.1:279-1859(-)